MAAFTWLYASAIGLRVVLLVAPGYIHPDEFFQAQEVAAIRRYSLDVPLAWEFDCQHPCRSSVLPLTAAAFAYGPNAFAFSVVPCTCMYTSCACSVGSVRQAE